MMARVCLATILALAMVRSAAADWPMVRSDAQRTGFTAESLPKDLSLSWKHRAAHAPDPAWPRSDRMDFDRAYQVVTAGDRVLYGSSADGIVYALDATTGQIAWQFTTDAPVRFAPAVWQDRIFVASDDGYLYALSVADGQLLWKYRGGPDHSEVLGNGQLVSRWPARGGPVVVDDTVYFAAGIWPSEGIYLVALDAASGSVRWCNDDSGAIFMPQPHGGANAKSGVSAQGYLAASPDQLFAPTGRAVPAAFDRQSGKFNYFHLQRYGHNGGSSITIVGDMLLNGGIGFDAVSGHKVLTVGAKHVVVVPDGLILAKGQKIETCRWSDAEQPDRRGQSVSVRSLQPIWSLDSVAPVTAMIAAADTIVCGFDGRIQVVDRVGQTSVWSATVDGVVHSLAASDGRLLVSTDKGLIYSFDGSAQLARSESTEDVTLRPTDAEPQYAQAVEEIVRRSGVTAGYCVDLGCGDGSLAMELARRTELRIYAVSDDAEQVAIARGRLTAAGLYGDRVVVHCRDLESTGYPPYFADLVVSARTLTPDGSALPTREATRLQRPCGGTVCTGSVGNMTVDVRGNLPGAGNWTHQYANAANTLTSDDTLAGGTLGMLWFRDVDFTVAQRHGRAPSPLYDQGRIFYAGLNGVIAVNAYNGRELWQYEIPGLLRAYDGDELMGVAGTGSNYCVYGDAVYVRDGARCLKLDAATGALVRQFLLPSTTGQQPGVWGHIACVDGVLYGSVANGQHIVTYRYLDTTGDMDRLLTESHSLFAMDATTGELLWQYNAAESIRHNAIAIGGGRVYLIDRPLAVFDREKRPAAKQHATGTLLALDAKTGEQQWATETDIYGTMLSLSETHRVLLMSYQPTRFRLDSEIGGRMTAFDAEDGQRRWEIQAGYESRPMIIGDKIYAQGGAWSLLSGEPIPFAFQRSYGCGILAASRKLLVFRSATLGYFNLQQNDGIQDYGGIRPGCWVNTLPAGGLVLLPDATAGCQCSYLNQSWIALVPMGATD